MPGASALVLPDNPTYTITASTDEFAHFSGVPKSELIGSSLFTFFPDNPEAPTVSDDIRKSLAKCIAEKQKNQLAVQRYDIGQPDGSFREMYWTVIHTPILDPLGEVRFIIHTAIDVTDRVHANIKDERIRSLEPMHNLFMQSAVGIQIFKGPDLLITFANNPSLEMWGRDSSVIGKPLREVLPELIEQNFHQLLHKVLLSGEVYHEQDAHIVINKSGNGEKYYLNFVLQPFFENRSTKATGVIAIVNDVTALYSERKILSDKERSLELAVEIGDLGVFSIDLQSQVMSYSTPIKEWLGV